MPAHYQHLRPDLECYNGPMNGRARGTEWFNSLTQSARPIGSIVLLLAVCAALTPYVHAQEATGDPIPRVRDAALHDAAVRINELLLQINERHLAAATHILDRAQSVLERIGNAAEVAARRGHDVSAVREAIAVAREAIDEARMAIREQADHEYVVSDATDRTIRDRLRALRAQLAADLQVVRNKVRLAVGAVRDAARALMAVRAVGE